MITYAIGDVHGYFDRLQRAIDWIYLNAGNNEFKCVFLGDYIDRGPESRKILSLIMNLTKSPQWIALMGNHEFMMLQGLYYRIEKYEDVWLRNGGIATLSNYYLDLADPNLGFDKDALNEALGFINQLPIWYEDDYRFFVHAGLPRHNEVLITPDNYKEHNLDEEVFLWQRSNRDCDEFPKLVVHGHTPSFMPPAVVTNRLNIDTGCGYESGKLTVARFDTSAPKKPTFKQF